MRQFGTCHIHVGQCIVDGRSLREWYTVTGGQVHQGRGALESIHFMRRLFRHNSTVPVLGGHCAQLAKKQQNLVEKLAKGEDLIGQSKDESIDPGQREFGPSGSGLKRDERGGTSVPVSLRFSEV